MVDAAPTSTPTEDMPMHQPGFFDFDHRLNKIDRNGDPLTKIATAVDWEIFRPTLEKTLRKEKKSAAGAKLYDVVLIFKILVLQSLSNLSDQSLEFQILDRHSFCRFLGIEMGDKGLMPRRSGCSGNS